MVPTIPLYQGLLLLEVWKWQSATPHSARPPRTSDRPVTEPSNWQHTTLTKDRHVFPLRGFRTRNFSKRTTTDPRFRLHGHRNRQLQKIRHSKFTFWVMWTQKFWHEHAEGMSHGKWHKKELEGMPSGWWKIGDLRARKRKHVCDVLVEKEMEGHWMDREEVVLGIRRLQWP